MKRFLLFTIILLSLAMTSFAQVYNNEWIDYNKTYYKFKVAATGLYRIAQPSLAALGIAHPSAKPKEQNFPTSYNNNGDLKLKFTDSINKNIYKV